MIFVQAKRYQLSLWKDGEQKGAAALHLEFDNRDDAERAFVEHRAQTLYRAGTLFEWRKQENDWVLLDRY